MKDSRVITDVKFDGGEPRAVVVKVDHGQEEIRLFSYYTDELHFNQAEFLGLTVDEALDLRRKRDIQYLRS